MGEGLIYVFCSLNRKTHRQKATANMALISLLECGAF